MSFPWLECTPPTLEGSRRRAEVAAAELAARAGLLYRLGFTVDAATRRLRERIAWEFDPSSPGAGPHRRPGGLSDDAVAKIVADTYARRPG